MPGRPDDLPKSPDKPKRFNPFTLRSRAMSSGGTSGFEAYTIGFTLVGCIAAGAGAGWFLDSRFGTGYWLPILFLLGVVAGFREMMVTLGRINKAQAEEKQAKDQARREREVTVKPTDNPTQHQIAARQRMFEVPPPPFEKAADELTEKAAPEEKVGVENVLEQMLAQGDLSEQELQELGFDVELPDENEK